MGGGPVGPPPGGLEEPKRQLCVDRSAIVGFECSGVFLALVGGMLLSKLSSDD